MTMIDNQRNPAIARAIKIAGGRRELSEMIGCHLNSIKNWLYRKSRVNLDHAIKINIVTKGKVSVKSILDGHTDNET